MSNDPQLPEAPPASEPWNDYADLQCMLSVEIAIPHFRVRDLLALELQEVVDSCWSHMMEVPVRLNGKPVMIANFEVLANRLALRIVEVV